MGEIIYLEATSNIFKDKKGRFLRVKGILRDVTKRCNIEEMLRHAQKMEAIGTLVNGIGYKSGAP